MSTSRYGMKEVRCVLSPPDTRKCEMAVAHSTVIVPRSEHRRRPYAGWRCCSCGNNRHKAQIVTTTTLMYAMNTAFVTYDTKSATSISSSFTGALITMSTEPTTVNSTPSASRIRKSSPKNTHAITAFDTTATAPSGVTTSAPAKPNAKKLPTSPRIVAMRPAHHTGMAVNGLRWLSGRASFWLCTHFCMFSPTLMTRLPVIASTTPATSEGDGPSRRASQGPEGALVAFDGEASVVLATAFTSSLVSMPGGTSKLAARRPATS
mmetsp:Transcript_20564/g.53139  ORF Transcript_20564/g.53139 Transcript_20564/m.53139 type:complete len:264 (+) Transcript_20564:1607-2398(+)